ncbi:MAG TPA: UDP-N-acetylmuramoyl-tripeptide--D-alanyl-D-alanine ligase [Pirellulales bacterium]|jgi:UDP-N-acetylmuramoyl-tripeptide--D-alanyl-D-alanine ligase
MTRLSVAELQEILDADRMGDDAHVDRPALRLDHVRIDSREVHAGDVFLALRGQNQHGNEFAVDAFERGAAAVIVDKPGVVAPEGRWVLQVEDTLQALRRAADWQRSSFTGRVVAVTGSAGKTTTRQMIDTVLGSRFSGTASPANYNNHLGVPLSMLHWQENDAYAVLEMGASARGEIAELCALARPSIGVITNIGNAHLGTFGGPAAVASAKGELLEALPADGLAILNGDDRQLRRIAERSRAVVEWFGRGADCDVMATDVRSAEGRLCFTVDGERFSVPVWGRHHLTSALAAVAIGRAFGLSVAEISRALSDFEPPPMRCQITNIGAARVINDAYNSNPLAMRAALEVLREDPSMGQRIVVCGDMRDLGHDAPRLHRQTGNEVVTVCGADMLVACGDHANDMVAGAIAAGMPRERTVACRYPEDAEPVLARIVGPGDVVLVKGSRSMNMERLLAGFPKSARRAA